jgi:hypothetical protein
MVLGKNITFTPDIPKEKINCYNLKNYPKRYNETMFVEQGKTNWSYILIVLALAFAVGGMALFMVSVI